AVPVEIDKDRCGRSDAIDTEVSIAERVVGAGTFDEHGRGAGADVLEVVERAITGTNEDVYVAVAVEVAQHAGDGTTRVLVIAKLAVRPAGDDIDVAVAVQVGECSGIEGAAEEIAR